MFSLVKLRTLANRYND